jgi:hypothetical protein
LAIALGILLAGGIDVGRGAALGVGAFTVHSPQRRLSTT